MPNRGSCCDALWQIMARVALIPDETKVHLVFDGVATDWVAVAEELILNSLDACSTEVIIVFDVDSWQIGMNEWEI